MEKSHQLWGTGYSTQKGLTNGERERERACGGRKRTRKRKRNREKEEKKFNFHSLAFYGKSLSISSSHSLTPSYMHRSL